MKVTTEDCINSIVKYLIEKENNFTNSKDWKRISKSGKDDNIIRKFQNKVSNREIYVRSSDSEIFEVSDKDFSMITNFKNFTGGNSGKIKTIDKIKSQKEFSEYLLDEYQSGKWITTKVDKEDSDAYANLIYQGVDEFRSDLESWGGWMCDDIEKYLDEPNLKIENHYLKDSDIVEIDSISFGDKLLLWSLHED